MSNPEKEREYIASRLKVASSPQSTEKMLWEYADIAFSNNKIPANMMKRLEETKNIANVGFERARSIVQSEEPELDLQDLLVLSAAGQNRLIRDARLGLVVSDLDVAKQVFGSDVNLREWFIENTARPGWLAKYSKWVESIPDTKLSFSQPKAHRVLLNAVATRDFGHVVPRRAWSPLISVPDFGYSMHVDEESGTLEFTAGNYKLASGPPLKTYTTPMNADLRLWVLAVVLMTVKAQDASGNVYTYKGIVQQPESWSETVTLTKGKTGVPQQVMNAQPMTVEHTEQGIFKNVPGGRPDQWVAVIEFVYFRTAENPKRKSDVLMSMPETSSEEDFAYFVMSRAKTSHSDTPGSQKSGLF